MTYIIKRLIAMWFTWLWKIVPSFWAYNGSEFNYLKTLICNIFSTIIFKKYKKHTYRVFLDRKSNGISCARQFCSFLTGATLYLTIKKGWNCRAHEISSLFLLFGRERHDTLIYILQKFWTLTQSASASVIKFKIIHNLDLDFILVFSVCSFLYHTNVCIIRTCYNLTHL